MDGITLSIGQIVVAFIAAMGIPSAITGFLIWNFERKITLRDKEKEAAAERERKKQEAAEAERRKQAQEHERAREELELILVQGTRAAIALGEATAKAVQRIPDAHCNGDMHEALEYAVKIKHEQKDFLARQGIKSIWE